MYTQTSNNPWKQHFKAFKIDSTRFYTGVDCETAKNGDEIFHFHFYIFIFFCPADWIDKVHHRIDHKILYKEKCIVNLSKFFVDIAKIVQTMRELVIWRKGIKFLSVSWFVLKSILSSYLFYFVFSISKIPKFFYEIQWIL